MIQITKNLPDYPKNRRFCDALAEHLRRLGRRPEVKQNGSSIVYLIDHSTPIYEETPTVLYPRIIGFKPDPD